MTPNMRYNIHVEPIDTNKSIAGIFKEWGSLVLISFIIAFSIRIFVFEFVRVEQISMLPTLEPNDKLGVNKAVYIIGKPCRGDISIIKINRSRFYVKRVVGMPGDILEIKQSIVYINGIALEEAYLEESLHYNDFSKVQVPLGHYFVMGDNRPNSFDSRMPEIGFIAERDFIGKAFFRANSFKWL
ncbi:MAG: signal peptidase I [Eubacteriaceae bacterium]|nr:signal peptidase I [Eubacteriaceae bacterium]